MGEIVEVPIEELVEDFTLYPRTDVSAMHVTRLADALAADETLPPIHADMTSKRIVDGIHRRRAYERAKRPTVPTILKAYKSDAEMFAHAIMLNRAHGRALDSFDIRRAVIRLMEYGFKPKQVGELVKVPLERIEEIRRGFALNRTDGPVALKAGTMHLAGSHVTRAQERAIEKYGGMQATFYARQLVLALESKLVKPTPALIAAMDELVTAWREFKQTLAS